MTEDFLHYLWKFKLLQPNIFTVDGQAIEVIDNGLHNKDAGPDFFNAKIRIGNTLWAGNVEMHIRSSDWRRHKHQADPAYKNVILHVVYEHDEDIKHNEKELIPTLILKDKFQSELYEHYQKLINNQQWIPCQNLLKQADGFVVSSWLETLMVERLEQKVIDIQETLKQQNNNWEETFYLHLARNFGFKLNSHAFEALAKSLPLLYLARHKNSLLQLEAFLFGQAGFLNGKFTDAYAVELQQEYKFLQNKFSLKPIDTHLWKFFRLRPVNFPTIRIAQFANLIFQSSGLFSRIIEAETIDDIHNMFQVKTSEYWDNHYVFDKVTTKRSKTLGNAMFSLIMINTIVPFLFLYSREKDNMAYQDKAFKFLESIKAESNSVIEHWSEVGIKATTAMHSQALLQLKSFFCDKKKCLDCRIGHHLLGKM